MARTSVSLGQRPGATIRHALPGARRAHAEPAFLAISELQLDTVPPLPMDVDGERRTLYQTMLTMRTLLGSVAQNVTSGPGWPASSLWTFTPRFHRVNVPR